MAVGERSRLRCEVRGAVQGVGFRPFVYRLATGLGLDGWVLNDARGVFLEVEGSRATLERFSERLTAEAPPHAVIESLERAWLEPAPFTGFEIRHSDGAGEKSVAVLPDLATCPDCLEETLEAHSRRFGYPFTNCTLCGPRFTIVRALPYDRPNTTMAGFALCEPCAREYGDPLDRRFHAQPIACPACGPHVELWDDQGESLATGEAAIASALETLSSGRIVAVKGLGGFHLMCDARDEAAVARLRERKRREEKPLAVMAATLDDARALGEIDGEAAHALASSEAPIVLVVRRADAPLAPGVAPRLATVGVMLPATPLHHLLARGFGAPLVATSGNHSEEPICTDDREALDRLGGIADRFLVHDRPIARHVDDSVGWIAHGRFALLRRARGFAPLPVRVADSRRVVLAVGPHLKNTIALAVGPRAFVSQHLGDLSTPEANLAFARAIRDVVALYEARPEAIAHDLHPDYESTRWAQRLAKGAASREGAEAALVEAARRLVPVQHHHAHLAACLAENGVAGPALGVVWDGTGYGTDGTIWGGEFLLGDASGFERVGHLRSFRLPGGEIAVREPWRVALALLHDVLGAEAFERDDLVPGVTPTAETRRVLARMIPKDLHSPATTSAGRLFDAVAALAGVRTHAAYEGQAAILLEAAADRARPDAGAAYPLPLVENDGGARVLDWRPMVRAILADRDRGVPPEAIAARFHDGLVEAIVTVAAAVRAPRVALTGGCFQNRRLAERAADRLRSAGHEVLLHRLVPPNDGGVSLGQIAVARAALERG